MLLMPVFSNGFSTEALNRALQSGHSNIPKVVFDSPLAFFVFFGSDHVFTGVSTVAPHFGHLTSFYSPMFTTLFGVRS